MKLGYFCILFSLNIYSYPPQVVFLKKADVVIASNILMSLVGRVSLLVLVPLLVHFEQIQQIIQSSNFTVGFVSNSTVETLE